MLFTYISKQNIKPLHRQNAGAFFLTFFCLQFICNSCATLSATFYFGCMSNSFGKSIKSLQDQDNKWLSLNEAANALKITRQALDRYRNKFKSKGFEKTKKDNRNRKRVYLSIDFIDVVKGEQEKNKKPFVIDRPIKNDFPNTGTIFNEDEIQSIKSTNDRLEDENEMFLDELEKLRIENEMLRDELSINEIETIEADNLPPLEARNGVVKYYFTEDEYHNMIELFATYPKIEAELIEAKKDLKKAHDKIDALTDKLLKVVDASYLTTTQFNRIEFEKVKSSTK
jgi:biotin operon repressor